MYVGLDFPLSVLAAPGRLLFYSRIARQGLGAPHRGGMGGTSCQQNFPQLLEPLHIRQGASGKYVVQFGAARTENGTAPVQTVFAFGRCNRLNVIGQPFGVRLAANGTVHFNKGTLKVHGVPAVSVDNFNHNQFSFNFCVPNMSVKPLKPLKALKAVCNVAMGWYA